MLLIGLAGLEVSGNECAWLRSPAVAGVILFSRNFASRMQLRQLTESIRSVGGEHLLIAVDQEGGVVQRFRDGFTPLPALSKIGTLYDSDPENAVALAEEHAWVMATELRASGVDLSLAPVADLARGNAAIRSRAFHADPEVTAELVSAYVCGMHLGGMASVLKHFPGHGSASADTHTAAAFDPRTLETIRTTDLRAFSVSFDARPEAVMMAYVSYSAIDPQPAGYSQIWIEEILRGKLGFSGLVISDDISMAAADAGSTVAQRVIRHCAAGCDLVLVCCPSVVEEAIAALPSASAAGTDRLAVLRGNVAAGWEDLLDNPQRVHFVARLRELDAGITL